MTSIWKRSLSLFLAIVMVVGMIPFSALAADEEVIEEEVLEIFEEVPEEEIVEEIIEEEIIEEEIFEEEVFEEIVEEEVVEEEVFFHTSDEVANAEAEPAEVVPAPEGDYIIWVNGHEELMEQEIMDMIAGENGIKTAVLTAVNLTEGTVTYDGMDVTGAGEVIPPQFEGTGAEWFALKKGEALAEELTNNANVAKFVIDGVEYPITFRDNRIKVKVSFGNTVISHKGEMTEADLKALIADQIKVTGNDPMTEGDDQIVITGYEVGYSEYQWPNVLDTKTSKIDVVVYGLSAYDYDVESDWSVSGSYTLEDTRAKYYVTWMLDEEEEYDAKVYVEGDEEPTVEDPEKEHYTFSGWDLTDDTVGAKVYTATWKADLDENRDGIADQTQKFQIIYYRGLDGVENITKQLWSTYAPWGEPISDYLPPEDKIVNGDLHFMGWTPALPKTVSAPKVEEGEDTTMILSFWGTWTEHPVVNFVSPATGEIDHTEIQEVRYGEKATDPLQAWADYYVYGWWTEENKGDVDKYFDFENTAITDNLTLYPDAILDTNGNLKADGSTEDPYIDYIWVVDGVKVPNVEYTYLKGFNEEIDGSYYTFPVSYEDDRLFVEWEANETDNSTADRVATLITYTPVFADDFNNNEVDDKNEKITVTVKGDGEVNLESGIYDSTADSIDVVATPVVVDGISKTYVSEIKINGTAVAPDFISYVAETALTKDDYKSEVTVEVTFADAAFTDGEGKVQADIYNDGYKTEDVYAAAVDAPKYEDATEATAKYKVHKDLSVKLDVSALKAALIDRVGEEVFAEFEGEYNKLTNGTDYYTHEYVETWNDVDVKVENKDAQRVIDDLVAYVTDRNNSLSKLKNELNDKLEQFKADINATGMHNFGEEPVETVKVTYTDDAKHLEGTYEIAIVDDRIVTEIVAADTEVVYGQYTATDLLKNVTLKGDDSGVYVDGNVDEIVKYGVGTYTIYVKYDANETHKGSEASYKLTVKKAPLTIKFGDDNIMASPENGNKWHNDAKPVTTPNTDQIIHMIAGVDIKSTDVDLAAGKINKIGAKAWLQLPADVWTLLDDVNADRAEADKIKLDDGEYSLSKVKELLETDGLEAVIPASAMSRVNDALDKLTEMTNKVGQNDLLVDVDFVREGETVFPAEIGVYINLAVSMDQNYESAEATGMIVIHPGVAMPNNGLDLKKADETDGQHVYTFQADAIEKLIVEGDAACEVRYFGLTNNADVHSAGTPTTPGIYVASAIKADANQDVISDAAIVIIYQNKGSVNIDNDVVTEDGEFKKPAVTAEGAYTLISAELDVGKKDVTINVDFPAGVTKVLNKLKIEALPDSVTLDQAIEKVAAIPAKIQEKLAEPLQTLSDFGIPVEKIQDYLDQGYGYFDQVVAKMNELKAELGETEVTVTFRDHKGYTKAGVYYYAAVVTDPEYLPAADIGYLVIETPNFDVEDATVTVGEEYTLEKLIKNNTEHDYITVISGNGNVNVVLDEEYGPTIRAKLVEQFGKNFTDGKAYAVSSLEGKPEEWADKLTDALMAKLTELAETEIKGYGLPEKLQSYALNRLEGAMNARKEQLVNELNEQIAKYSNLTLTVNGELPTEVGTYKVRALSYAVAYDAAVLEIQDDFFRTNIRMGTDLSLMFAFEQSRLDSLDGVYARITHDDKAGVKTIEAYTDNYDYWSKLTLSGVKYYVVEFEGLAARQMADDVTIQIFDAEGKALSPAYTTSMRKYAMDYLATSKKPLFDVALVDMLNYGAEAQLYFDYNEADLANNQLSEEQKALASEVGTYIDNKVIDDKYDASNLRFKNKINLMYRMNIENPLEKYVVWTWTDHKGNAHNVRHDVDRFTQSDGKVVFELDELVVADARMMVTCTIYNSDGTVYSVVTNSVEGSVAASKVTSAVRPLYENFMKFSDSAHTYLHNK